MHDEGKISIIVPYWNSNLFKFRKCIQSLKEQSYRYIEILLILDGYACGGGI